MGDGDATTNYHLVVLLKDLREIVEESVTVSEVKAHLRQQS